MNIYLRVLVFFRRLKWRVFAWALPKNMESWSVRDQMLMDQWWAALRNRNYEECDRIREMINKNWIEYLESNNVTL